jgi:predicted DNA binding CopG/RHH family protein
MIEAIADAFERGEWLGNESKIVKGRPLMFDERLRPVTFKVPENKIAALDSKASSLGLTRSDYLRKLLDDDLVQV